MGMEIPQWITSWEVLTIALGIIAGLKHRFRKPGAYMMILIGSIFLLNDLVPSFQLHEIAFPIAVTSLGIFLILKRNNEPFAEKMQSMAPL